MSSVEIFGFFLTIAGVVLASHQHLSSWLLSIVSSIIYIFIFFQVKLYADVLLQFFFISLSVYGFYCWKEGKSKLIAAVRKITKKEIFLSTFFVIFSCSCLYFFLNNFTNSDVPFADSFLTTLSLLATWLTAKKIIENWWIWIVADILYSYLFWYKELYVTSFLYLILSSLAIYGLVKWKKQILEV